MDIRERARQFSERHGKTLTINSIPWRYYRAGAGAPPILWLTGGLRRAGLGFSFLEKLSARHAVIAPDYPPVGTIAEFLAAFDAILRAENVSSFILGGQSYGGLLAQAYLARRGADVARLILSSSGPADYGRAWLPVEYLAIALARLLPERTVKSLLAGGLLKAITLPEGERAEWADAIETTLRDELSRADVISHFAVAADLIRAGIVRPAAYRNWAGRIIVLSAENDPTQSEKDFPRYEALFGRPVEVLSLGTMGHAAALFDPDRYVALLEQALA